MVDAVRRRPGSAGRRSPSGRCRSAIPSRTRSTTGIVRPVRRAAQEHLGVQREARQRGSDARAFGSLGGVEHRRAGIPRPCSSAGASSGLAEPEALRAAAPRRTTRAATSSRGRTTRRRRAARRRRSATQQPPGSVPTRCWVRRIQVGAALGRPQLRVGPRAAEHPGVELVERRSRSPARPGCVVDRHRPDPHVAHRAHNLVDAAGAPEVRQVGGARMTRMRVLIAPDKFAGTLTAVEAARGDRRRAGAAGRPTTSSTSPRWPTAGPGFVDVLHEALGGELLGGDRAGPHGEPVPGDGAAPWRAAPRSRAPRPAGSP